METHPRLVEALLTPDAYPGEAVAAVELVETHISYIFFTGEHVYKIKKPVDYGFLDFTTLEKRRDDCCKEVALNRRISPEVYLGVVEIREQAGQYVVEGPGRTAEYAVKMRRLPRDRSMDILLRQGLVSAADVERIALRTARFHQRAATGPYITAQGNLQAVRRNVEENFAQTRKFVGTALSADAYDELVAYSRAFMDTKKDVFQAREKAGRIRDCHGDLHTAQIFLETPAEGGDWDGISIIDCIEFNERFRYSDVAEDIAFLAMDLDHHGRPDLALAFVAAYVRESKDASIVELLTFFKLYRAYVRGKVTSFRLDDPHLPEESRDDVLQTACAYFRLAHAYIPVFPCPAVIIVAGVTGTGKSTVAIELARRWRLAYISSDITRKRLAGVDLSEHRYAPFLEDIYAPQFSHLTYEAVLQETRQQLQSGTSIIIDATFRLARERRRVVETAQEMGADIWIVECTLSEEEARRRLEKRFTAGESVSDGRWELYHQQLAQWTPVTEVPPERHLRLDTGGSFEQTMRRLLQGLYASVA